MRTTLTINDDVAALLQKENHRAKEPMKQTVNRVLLNGLLQPQNAIRRQRFVVKPFDTGLTSEQWRQWEGKTIEDILDEVETPVAQ